MDWRIPSDAVEMRASHAVNENLPSRKVTQPFHFMCKIGDIFSSNTLRTKNYKRTCALHRHMRSSAFHCQVFCAHTRRLRHVSVTNGLAAMAHRRKKNSVFPKTHLRKKIELGQDVQKFLLHFYVWYLATPYGEKKLDPGT